MTLPEIQSAIELLSKDEQERLAAWVVARDGAIWDAEIDRDFGPGGAGAELLEKVRREVRAGESRPFTQRPSK